MPNEQQFLADIQNEDADVRFAAWRRAGEESPSAIPQLGKLAASDTPGVTKAAREALTTMTHSVGKETTAENRPAVIDGLVGLTSDSYALPVRALAYQLVSNLADSDQVVTIAAGIQNADLREEVVYCLERIPGDASVEALIDAYPGAAEEFKPRILAALGHRRTEAAVGICVEAMGSSNKDLAVAGVKALGRIGKTPPDGFSHPDLGALSGWEQIDVHDSMLRYADAQVAAGNASDAMHVYESMLNREEEHWQCAAIIGIAKIGTAEAAGVIFSKLKSDNSTVRITAEKAWNGMAKTGD